MKKEIAHCKNVNGTSYITYCDGSKDVIKPNGKVITFSKSPIPKTKL